MFPVPASPGGRRARRWPSRINNVRPQQHYTEIVTVPLNRQGQTIVASDGTATVSMGPSGVGAKWYPSSAMMTTTTGNMDVSRVSLYLGVVSKATLLNGQVYFGGGDTAGIDVPFLTPGDILIAHWTLGNPGDVAQLSVTGTQDALNT